LGRGRAGPGVALAIALAKVIPTGVVPLRAHKAYIVGLDFHSLALVAAAVLIASGLDGTRHRHHLAFGEVFADKFRRVPPSHHVNPVGLALLALPGVVPTHRQGERGHSHTGGSMSQFWVGRKPSYDSRYIQHVCALTFSKSLCG